MAPAALSAALSISLEACTNPLESSPKIWLITKHQKYLSQTFIKEFVIREERHHEVTCSEKVGLWNGGEWQEQQQTEQLTERNRLPAALEFKLTPNYVFRFQCSNNSSFKYSEFVFMSDSSNDYKWRLYPVVFVKSEQCPILWNLALIHFSKDAMSMLIVSQITIDIQQRKTKGLFFWEGFPRRRKNCMLFLDCLKGQKLFSLC